MVILAWLSCARVAPPGPVVPPSPGASPGPVARPLDLAPLAACGEGDTVQLALLGEVRGLREDDAGLWIADVGSLTVRDPETLAIRRVIEPGVTDWTWIHELDGAIFVAGRVGWFADGRRGNPELPQTYGYGPGWVGSFGTGPLVRDGDHLFGGYAVDRSAPPRWVLSRDAADGSREILYTIPRLRRRAWTLAGERGQRLMDLTGLGTADFDDARGFLVRPGGGFVTSTESRLALHDADGGVTTSVPHVPYTDAVGIVRDRLFTVREGRLEVWDARGLAWWRAPGTYASAVAWEDGLLATDPAGQLYAIDLDAPAVQLRGCLLDDCADGPPIPRRPAPGDDYGARIAAWALEISRLSHAHRRRPVDLMVVGDHLVAAALDDFLWRGTEAVHAVGALGVVDPDRGRVERWVELPTLLRGPLRRVGPDAVRISDRTFSVPGLEPLAEARHADGPALRFSGPGDAVVHVGRYANGRFEGAPGLPPRISAQYRVLAHGDVVGERFVLSNLRMLQGGGAQATQVWCLPPLDGPPRTAEPGLLGTPFPYVRPRGADPHQASIDHYLVHGDPRRAYAGSMGEAADDVLAGASAEGPILYWHAFDATALPPELRDVAVPVLVTSVVPASGPLPDNVSWQVTAERHGYSLQLVDHGVVVWLGDVEALRLDELLDTADR